MLMRLKRHARTDEFGLTPSQLFLFRNFLCEYFLNCEMMAADLDIAGYANGLQGRVRLDVSLH